MAAACLSQIELYIEGGAGRSWQCEQLYWVLRSAACGADVRGPPALCRERPQVFEGRVTEGDPNNVGHVVTTTGGYGANKQVIRYLTERVVGNGSFGTVFQVQRGQGWLWGACLLQ